MSVIYLGLKSPAASINLPFAAFCRNRIGSGQPHNCNLFGLSTCKVCTTQPSPAIRVSSYLTFSPFPKPVLRRGLNWWLFSVTLAVNKAFSPCCLPVQKYTALRCPDFPPASARMRWPATDRFARNKRTKKTTLQQLVFIIGKWWLSNGYSKINQFIWIETGKWSL